MEDFLRFENMITPVAIQVIFWIVVVIVVIAGFAQIAHGGLDIITGIVTLILGPLLARISCEIVIVLFEINDRLREIERNSRA